MEVIVPRATIPISATMMRAFLIHGDVENWHKYANPKIHKFYGRLREELLATEPYQEIHRNLITKKAV